MKTNRADDLFEKLIASGEAGIDELIASRKSEELFLDFKRSKNDGDSPNLEINDRNNFGKAISGFGNSEGGVIVWGVDCSKGDDGADVASMKVPIRDAPAFASRLEGAVSGATIPPHSGVRSVAIPTAGLNKGFVVTHIPKSNVAPHQAVSGLKYYMRAGSDFVPVPHGVLAGMFGKRPAPSIGPMYICGHVNFVDESATFEVSIAIRNDGPAIARDVFLTLMGKSMPNPTGCLAFKTADLSGWTLHKSFGVHMSYMSPDGFRMPPDSQVLVTTLEFVLRRPFSGDLRISGLMGCEGAPPALFELGASHKEIDATFGRALNLWSSGERSADEINDFPKSILALP